MPVGVLWSCAITHQTSDTSWQHRTAPTTDRRPSPRPGGSDSPALLLRDMGMIDRLAERTSGSLSLSRRPCARWRLAGGRVDESATGPARRVTKHARSGPVKSMGQAVSTCRPITSGHDGDVMGRRRQLRHGRTQRPGAPLTIPAPYSRLLPRPTSRPGAALPLHMATYPASVKYAWLLHLAPGSPL